MRNGHKSSYEDLLKINNLIQDGKFYQIRITDGCGEYNEKKGKGSHGFKNSGYIGCISIKEL